MPNSKQSLIDQFEQYSKQGKLADAQIILNQLVLTAKENTAHNETETFEAAELLLIQRKTEATSIYEKGHEAQINYLVDYGAGHLVQNSFDELLKIE